MIALPAGLGNRYGVNKWCRCWVAGLGMMGHHPITRTGEVMNVSIDNAIRESLVRALKHDEFRWDIARKGAKYFDLPDNWIAILDDVAEIIGVAPQRQIDTGDPEWDKIDPQYLISFDLRRHEVPVLNAFCSAAAAFFGSKARGVPDTVAVHWYDLSMACETLRNSLQQAR